MARVRLSNSDGMTPYQLWDQQPKGLWSGDIPMGGLLAGIVPHMVDRSAEQARLKSLEGSGAIEGIDPEPISIPINPKVLEAIQPQAMDFDAWRKLAQSFLGPAMDYSPLMDRARGNASAGDARIAALYSQLSSDINADRSTIGQTFDSAVGRAGQSGTDTRALINAAYDSAAQKRNAQFEALGILPSDDRANMDQAAAISRSAQNQGITENLMNSNRATSLDFNTGMSEGVGQQGAEMRAALERALMDRLAQLDIAQQEANAGRGTKEMSILSSLMGMAPMIDPVLAQQQGRQQEFENELAAQKFALEQRKVLGSQSTIEDLLNMNNEFSQVAQQGGIANDPEAVEQWLSNLMTQQKLLGIR